MHDKVKIIKEGTIEAKILVEFAFRNRCRKKLRGNWLTQVNLKKTDVKREMGSGGVFSLLNFYRFQHKEVYW